jgi:hypothetical protein
MHLTAAGRKDWPGEFWTKTALLSSRTSTLWVREAWTSQRKNWSCQGDQIRQEVPYVLSGCIRSGWMEFLDSAPQQSQTWEVTALVGWASVGMGSALLSVRKGARFQAQAPGKHVLPATITMRYLCSAREWLPLARGRSTNKEERKGRLIKIKMKQTRFSPCW